MPRSIVGIDQYSRDSYAQLEFGYENQLDKHIFIPAILQVEICWTKVTTSAMYTTTLQASLSIVIIP